MNAHSAKTAALIAYDLGVLSDAGRARLDRHLAGCALCTAKLTAIRAYEQLRIEATEQRWPEPNWNSMELTLRREAKAAATETRLERAGARNALYGGFAAAAAILLAMVGGSMWPHGAATPSADTAPIAYDEGAPRQGTVTAIAGHAMGDAHALALGDTVSEDARLVTSAASTTHLRLGDGTGFVLAADTTVTLERSRERATVLRLESGRITSRVAHLDEGARYEILAAPYVVHVRGTHFSVSRQTVADGGAAIVTVTVHEGVVEVTENTALVARVEGPSRWSAPEDDAGLHPSVLVDPIALAPETASWPSVQIPVTRGVASIEFDGLALPLAGAIAMRTSVGAHTGVAFDLRGVPTRFSIDVGPEGASLDPTLMLAPVVADDEPRRGTLDPAVVRDVVTRGMDGVQRCYQTALMRRPDLAGHMSLRITVDPTGHVSRATLATIDAPYPWLSACVENQAAAWSFPAPSGGASVSLSVPLDFATN